MSNNVPIGLPEWLSAAINDTLAREAKVKALTKSLEEVSAIALTANKQLLVVLDVCKNQRITGNVVLTHFVQAIITAATTEPADGS